MKKFVALMIGNILVAQGCKDSTFIADELPEDTQAGLDTLSDSDSEPISCEGLSATPGDTDRTIQVGDDSRSYVLHIPAAYTGATPAPLIVDYHAIGGSGANERSASPYPPVTDAEGVVMAFPTGLAGPLGTAWNIGPCCVDNVDDVAFTRAMVADIEATACIDPSRIYAVGIIMGGGMAYHLACQSADMFAAIAPQAFDMIEETVEECTPPRPVTVISFRSTSDTLVPYDGGYSTFVPGHPVTFLGAVNTFEKWAEINGCTGVASDVGNGCQMYTESQCEGGVEVMLCEGQGDATISWPVLKRHSLP